jgi:hypothetical protein
MLSTPAELSAAVTAIISRRSRLSYCKRRELRLDRAGKLTMTLRRVRLG